MRIAVVADVHGNLPALRAVLAELDRDPVDALAVAGDIVGGPKPGECLDLLQARPEPLYWIRGNAEREAVAAYDGAPVSADAAGRAAAWSATALDGPWRDELASWPIVRTVGGICICHGSPRSDEEILTRATPLAVLRQALGSVGEPLVVGGHTHQQFIRRVSGRLVYANAGSVGLPYEGRAAAFWMVVGDGCPELRATGYDLRAGVRDLRTSGFAELDDHLGGSLLDPVDPDWATAFFEHSAGRGEHPGEAWPCPP